MRRWCAFGFDHCGVQERVDDRQRLLDGVHPPADPDQLRVVVLTGQRRGLDAPPQRTAHPGTLFAAICSPLP